jgi:ribosome-associated toxin RatA of RatAB toxin-antitoxin module
MLAALGRRASEASIIGTRTQVLAALYVQERWRHRQQRLLAASCKDEEPDMAVTVEIEVDISLDTSSDDDISLDGDSGQHRQHSPVRAAPAAAPPPPPAQPAQPPPVAPQPPPAVASSASTDQGTVEKEMIVANRSVDDVFAVVAGFDDYPKWVTGLQKVETLERDKTTGRGSVVQFTAGAMGLSISYTLQYTVHTGNDDDLVLAWQSIAGGVKSIEGSYHLSPVDGNGSRGAELGETTSRGGTRVRYKLNVDTGFKMPWMLKRTATSLVVGAALPDLKRYLEQGGGAKS